MSQFYVTFTDLKGNRKTSLSATHRKNYGLLGQGCHGTAESRVYQQGEHIEVKQSG